MLHLTTERVDMKIEEVIGENVLRVREGLGLSQAQLGDAIADYLGRPWSRQAVSSAEKGRRAFTAAELLVLAEILKTTVYRLMTPPISVADIEMPAQGVTVKAKKVTQLTLPSNTTAEAFEEAGGELDQLGHILEQIAELGLSGRKALGRAHGHLANASWSMAARIEETGDAS
ncbi:helix-turn-helix transcriptional regulator [Streptosporangium minutum]|uniref:helix-turn-helix transcriptional regulator n=1 Tax=Streptosporangium minutum TaxID=569862 RepID=UPI001055532F|nr:helix-turn-helix transcriptional regulator [Streptosporangium minutum]